MKKKLLTVGFISVFILSVIVNSFGSYAETIKTFDSDNALIPSSLGISEADLSELDVNNRVMCDTIRSSEGIVEKWYRYKNQGSYPVECILQPTMSAVISDRDNRDDYMYSVDARAYDAEGNWIAYQGHVIPNEGDNDGIGLETNGFFAEPNATIYIKVSGKITSNVSQDTETFYINIIGTPVQNTLSINEWVNNENHDQDTRHSIKYAVSNPSEKELECSLERNVSPVFAEMHNQFSYKYSATVFNYKYETLAEDHERKTRTVDSGSLFIEETTDGANKFYIKPHTTVYVEVSSYYRTRTDADYLTYKTMISTSDSGEITGGDTEWEKPTYQWSNDCSMVVATRKSKTDPSIQETEVVYSTSFITKEPSYTTKGETTYIATFNNPAFERQRKTIANIPMLLKKAQTLRVTASSKTIRKINLKKALTFRLITIKKAVGSVTFKKTSGNKNITVNKKNGKVTIKKGLKKGTYRIKVKVKASGNYKFKPASKTVTVVIKVK